MRRITWEKVDIEIKKYIDALIAEDRSLRDLIRELIIDHEVFVVGGLIRDYLIGSKENISHRDIDFVVNEIDDNAKHILAEFSFKANSFGGYKIKTEKHLIDLWEIGMTWAIISSGYFNNLLLKETFPSSTFFNVTAAIYSINNAKLTYSEEFRKGIQERRVNIIYEPNPIPEMCILKTLEYFHEKNFRIGNELYNFIRNKRQILSRRKFEEIQYTRYGEVKYEVQSIDELIEILEMKKQYKKALKASLYNKENVKQESWIM